MITGIFVGMEILSMGLQKFMENRGICGGPLSPQFVCHLFFAFLEIGLYIFWDGVFGSFGFCIICILNNIFLAAMQYTTDC